MEGGMDDVVVRVDLGVPANVKMREVVHGFVPPDPEGGRAAHDLDSLFLTVDIVQTNQLAILEPERGDLEVPNQGCVVAPQETLVVDLLQLQHS